MSYLTIRKNYSLGEVLCQDPFVCVIDSFISVELCDHLVELAESKMTRATVVQNGRREISDARTNQVTFIPNNSDSKLASLVAEVAEMINVPESHAESLQVINYGPGQHYNPHFDTFNADNPNENGFIEKSGQRIATVLVYLNDVEKGGETHFPNLGLDIRPQKGRAVIFQSCEDDSNYPDKNSLHGSRPVEEGQKWAANLWFRENEFVG